MPDVIAIVGRPNVGKSALFNRIAGRRIAIVHDQPGVTRDRVSAEVEWHGRPFTLIDTGGIGLARGERSSDALAAAAVDQVQLAIDSAQLILFVVNAQEGLTPLDEEVARRLRASGQTTLLVANKVDHDGVIDQTADFASLGFERTHPVSAIHGLGIVALMEAAFARMPAPAEGAPDPATEEPTRDRPLRLALVGRPNVGKSSIINALTRSNRVIVSPVPGTTRDAIDVPFTVHTEGRVERYILTDTAGIRKNLHAQDTVEFFSAQRSEHAIERCDIAVLVLDAEAGILEQDKRIAGKIVEHHRACVVVVNKWDLASEAVAQAREKAEAFKEKKNRASRQILTTLGEYGEWVQDTLFFIDYAPVIFASAQTTFNLDRLLEAIRYVADQLRQKVPTAILNRTLNDAIERRQPVSASGHRLRFYYATQVRQAPPTFLLFVNRQELFSPAYAKYLSTALRQAFGYEGCPLVLAPKARPKTIETIRSRRSAPSPNLPRSESTRRRSPGQSRSPGSRGKRQR
ncbi:MAG: ribosome biogenesis GTPase Der [Verrucomicrobia bacterium]|nr:ribosome biogenesis GTPase Der [Verrucomicrobiota bacterium]